VYINFTTRTVNYAGCQISLEMREKAYTQCIHIDNVNPKIQGNTKKDMKNVKK
jgi:hypothetical protein